VQQYLRAGLVDEMHIAVAPVVLGGGERLFDDVGTFVDGYDCVQLATSGPSAHFRLSKP